MSFVRSENPVWYFVDNLGDQLNDQYYIFFLTNELPYIPQDVYQTPNGTPWANPLQFNPNGTLPDNIYFDPSLVYRLEVRRGNSQSDPLAFQPVQNYVPNGSGVQPPSDFTLSTINQVTNPQFSVVNFANTLTLTSVTDISVQVAPGWTFIGTGTGNVSFQKLEFTGDENISTNPSYGLNIITSGGWTDTKLRQRFNHNGALWASQSVCVSLTIAALDTIANTFTVDLVDSNGAQTEIIGTTALNADYKEVVNAARVDASENPDGPSIAYTDLVINLPLSANVGITSVQLIGEDEPLPLPYAQETLERQEDHLFHYYKNSILLMPKDNILVGWDFGLNPWQFSATGGTTLATANAIYTADNTILFAQSGANNISYAQASASLNSGFQVTALTNNNRFAIIQYVPIKSAAPYFGEDLSALVHARVVTTHGTAPKFKMRIIYRNNAIPVISNTQPIASWSGSGDPVFASGWTAIAPLNDPEYTLSGSPYEHFSFDQFQLPFANSSSMVFGVVIYTTTNLNSASTADSIIFNKVNLTRNSFGIDCNPKSFDQTLRECQFFYEKSYPQGTQPGTALAGSFLSFPQKGINGTLASPTQGIANMFGFQYRTQKCQSSPIVTLYSANTGTAAQLYGVVRKDSVLDIAGDIALATYWTSETLGEAGVVYQASNGSPFLSGTNGTSIGEAYIQFHYTINSNLGAF